MLETSYTQRLSDGPKSNILSVISVWTQTFVQEDLKIISLDCRSPAITLLVCQSNAEKRYLSNCHIQFQSTTYIRKQHHLYNRVFQLNLYF